jgi:DNA-binding MarR family transcriptional regulator
MRTRGKLGRPRIRAVDVIRLNRLARQLREIALQASQGGAELPISVAQLAVVEAVARNPDSTVSMISKSTGLAQSWVSKIVRELSDQGVFAHSKNPHDRRQTRVRLDAEIRRQTFENHGARAIDDALARNAPHLDASGVRRVIELLAELDGLLDSPPADVGAVATRVVTS